MPAYLVRGNKDHQHVLVGMYKINYKRLVAFCGPADSWGHTRGDGKADCIDLADNAGHALAPFDPTKRAAYIAFLNTTATVNDTHPGEIAAVINAVMCFDDFMPERDDPVEIVRYVRWNGKQYLRAIKAGFMIDPAAREEDAA